MVKILGELHPISVRGVAYQLFTRGHIPSVKGVAVKAVGRLLTKIREDGTIPWPWIVDETRAPERVLTWPNLEDRLRHAAGNYRKDPWLTQPYQIEVWAEKGTVRGVLRDVLEEFAVTFRVFHGFASATALHDIAEQTMELPQPLIALYVGDWDPSGLSMSEEDIPKRLARYGGRVDLRRIALLEADLSTLPSFDVRTKAKDSRAEWFKARFGERCWELDALSPEVLRQRVREAIAAEIDWPLWNQCALAEEAEQKRLRMFVARMARRAIPTKGAP